MKDLEKYIQQKVSEALEGSFSDAQIYGIGLIKIEVNGSDVNVEHVAFDQVEDLLEKIAQQKKFLI